MVVLLRCARSHIEPKAGVTDVRGDRFIDAASVRGAAATWITLSLRENVLAQPHLDDRLRYAFTTRSSHVCNDGVTAAGVTGVG